eukprot:9186932-Pyramimonas_sp.AAC.2
MAKRAVSLAGRARFCCALRDFTTRNSNRTDDDDWTWGFTGSAAAGGSHPEVYLDGPMDGLEASVVVMNWKRVANVRQILDALVTYRAVKEIILWHCNRETIFFYDHPKVRIKITNISRTVT